MHFVGCLHPDSPDVFRTKWIHIKFRPEIQRYSRTKQMSSHTKQKCQAFHFVFPLPPLQLNVFQNVRNVHVGWTDDAAAVEVEFFDAMGGPAYDS